jgi:hypothetical protein
MAGKVRRHGKEKGMLSSFSERKMYVFDSTQAYETHTTLDPADLF